MGLVPGRLRTACALLAFGICGLMAMAAVERLPSPAVNVRWAETVTPERRAALERRYSLSKPNAEEVSYDIADVGRANVEALVRDPSVLDTHHIDRGRYIVRLYEGRAEWAVGAAYQRLRLYDWRVRLVWWFALFALPAGLGLAGVARHRPRDRGVRDLLSPERGDLFDRLAAGPAPAAQMPKVIAGALLLLALGPPILAAWEAFILALLLLTVVFGVARPGRRQWAAAVALVATVIGMKAVLPRADIAEAHNAFIVTSEGGPLEEGLPDAVFQSWKAQFDSLYPSDGEPEPFSWRADGVGPAALHTSSTDAIWRPAKYTRQVDSIRFRSLADFRGGFSNEARDPGGVQYNFWAGDMLRESMPFYVMYELTPAAAGSRLTWTGQLFWELAPGRFEEIVHEQPASRAITAADAGRRVYAAFFPARSDPYMELEPSLALRLSAWLKTLFTIAAAIGVVALTIVPRWGSWLRATTIFGAAYGFVIWTASGRWMASGYAPHSGGDDGMVHDGWGRLMAQLASRGEILEALKGGEAVYWFTPGTRYVRMAEKLIFGDTNHLYVLTLACIPLVLFYLMRHFIGARGAWAAVALFVLMPAGNLSFLQYIAYARAGYGEAVGAGLFFLGLTLLIRHQPAWGGATPQLHAVWTGAAALAGAMFIRPNFALAVAWIGAAYWFVSLRRRDIPAAAVVTAGLGLALWMPFHNWYYGGEPYLISRSGATVSVPLDAGAYVGAVADALRGETDSGRLAAVGQQLRGWLAEPGYVSASWWAPVGWLVHLAKLAGLLLAGVIAVRWIVGGGKGDAALAVVAVASLLAHLPMMFIFSTHYRYAMLAWDLSLLVLIVGSVSALGAHRARAPLVHAAPCAGAA